jgi:hypothetical protein
MSGIARIGVSHGKSSTSGVALARPGSTTVRSERARRNNRALLERLEAENLELRNRAIQLALQIQSLRRVGRSTARSASRSRA